MRSLICFGIVFAACSQSPSLREPHPGVQSLAGAIDRHGDAVKVGDGPLVVVVFASWCQPCRNELRELRTFRARMPRVQLIAVNAYESYESRSDSERLDAFLRANHPDLQVVIASPRLLRRLGGVAKVPTLLVFDRRGALYRRFRAPNVPNAEELQALIRPLERG